MKIIYSDNKNSFIESNIEKPCIVCGKLTNKIEIHFESRICSDECCIKLINQYMKEVK